MRTIRRVVAALSATLLAILGMALTSPAAHSAPQTSQVSVLHAVPGATVDVWANGKPLLTKFTPGTLTQPMALPAGSYDIKIVKAGDPATAAAVIEAKGLKVPGGANLTLVAHLDAMGKPVLTAFANDTSASSKGARLTVRHVAAAPAVDVRAGGKVVVPGLVNPKQAALDLMPGTVSADVVLAGTDTVAIGPADVKLSQGHNTIVYAWGSAEGKSLALAVQQVRLSGVGLPHTGVADEPTSNTLPIVASAVTVALVGALALRRTRSAVRN